MKRSTTNVVVDIIALATMMLLGSTGALIRYVLPPGSGHFSQLWGMDRHRWGQIHFWIAVVLLCAVALHLVLHGQWIVSMIRGRSDGRPGMRVGLAVVGLMVLVGLMAAPFFGQIQQTGEPPHKTQSKEHPSLQINGSMTLREVEEKTGVPAAVILSELGLPASLSTDERLGRLRRQYGFEMHDIQEVVRKYREQR
jgi:hypothetical protein